jgi:hypothetical protein
MKKRRKDRLDRLELQERYEAPRNQSKSSEATRIGLRKCSLAPSLCPSPAPTPHKISLPRPAHDIPDCHRNVPQSIALVTMFLIALPSCFAACDSLPPPGATTLEITIGFKDGTESDRRFGCSCDSWICSRHPSARAFKRPLAASSRVADFKTETITSARTCAATRDAPTVNLAASTIYSTYAPKLVPTVVPTATLGTYMTVITTPVTESAAHTTISAAAKGVMASAVLLRPTHWNATVLAVRFSATSSSMFATMISVATEPALFAQPARKILTPLMSPTTAPKPAAATMAYCTKGFYDEQYIAACGAACGSTSDQAATPDAMPAISLTVGSSDTNAGASMINCHPWKQKQPGQHLDQRNALASLTTTHRPALNGGNSHAAKRYQQHGNRAYTLGQEIEVEKDQLNRPSYLQVATLHRKGGAIVPPHRW